MGPTGPVLHRGVALENWALLTPPPAPPKSLQCPSCPPAEDFGAHVPWGPGLLIGTLLALCTVNRLSKTDDTVVARVCCANPAQSVVKHLMWPCDTDWGCSHHGKALTGTPGHLCPGGVDKALISLEGVSSKDTRETHSKPMLMPAKTHLSCQLGPPCPDQVVQ